MTFAWPLVLFGLLLVPLLVGFYLLLQRRKRRYAVRYPSLSLIRDVLPRRSRWRRHLPFAIYLLAAASLVVAAARPQAVIATPLNRSTVILALDVSLSMCSTDVEPNRLTVAQQVARDFIEDQPGGTRIGIVAFSGIAQLVVAPTTDRELLLQAIDGLQAARGTAVGSAMLKAVDAIAEINPNVAPTGVSPDSVASGSGEYAPDIVVLLTDGATTQGVDPLFAAEEVAARKVRVYTVAFGTSEPQALVCSREQLGSSVLPRGFGGGGTGGGGRGGSLRQALMIDEGTLQVVADTTGGSYYKAEDAEQLKSVFEEIPQNVALQEEEMEVSVAFAAVGALLAVVAVGLSLLWNRFP